jgi:ElaB/YqjD/DUF883 family membrane-anchored ribosome-binding protein
VAKKKTTTQSSSPAEANASATDGSKQDADRSPRVRKAAEAVRRAEAELEKAQQLYQKVRQEATDRLRAVREKRVGDLIDGTLELVKKHPGPGVIVAAMIGFFLGRLFRR